MHPSSRGATVWPNHISQSQPLTSRVQVLAFPPTRPLHSSLPGPLILATSSTICQGLGSPDAYPAEKEIGERVRYRVLRIAVPSRGRALPLLQLAYYRDNLPQDSSQNKLEEEALEAVLRSLPPGVRAVILADRGLGRTEFIWWLQAHKLEYVIRVKRGTCITEPDGRHWKLGEQQLKPGEYAYSPGVRYALHQGRPTDVVVHLALCWKVSKSRLRREHKRQRNQHKQPKEPW